jgi:hypothetical protein
VDHAWIKPCGWCGTHEYRGEMIIIARADPWKLLVCVECADLICDLARSSKHNLPKAIQDRLNGKS